MNVHESTLLNLTCELMHNDCMHGCAPTQNYEFANQWTDKRGDGWLAGWMEQVVGWMGELIYGRMDGWIDGQSDGLMDGRMDGWVDGWIDWMDG